MSDAKFHLVARGSIIASGDTADFHHVAPDEVVLVSAEAFDRVTRERDEADAMLECQVDGIPPCHGPGKQDYDMCRACLLSRCRRAERERDEAQEGRFEAHLARQRAERERDEETRKRYATEKGLVEMTALAEKAERERDEARRHADLRCAQLAMLSSEVDGDSKLHWLHDRSDPRWTPALQEAWALRQRLKELAAQTQKAEAERDALNAALRDIVAIGERCNCDGYCGPCGCGERAEDVAREALGEVES